MKNQLFLKDLQQQKENYIKKLEEISLKVQLQEEVKRALNRENAKIMDGLNSFQGKNVDLNQDIEKLIGVIKDETKHLTKPDNLKWIHFFERSGIASYSSL